MTLDEKLWAADNKCTKIDWTEEEIVAEYITNGNIDGSNVAWCRLMLAGILGSTEAAAEKYPELWV